MTNARGCMAVSLPYAHKPVCHRTGSRLRLARETWRPHPAERIHSTNRRLQQASKNKLVARANGSTMNTDQGRRTRQEQRGTGRQVRAEEEVQNRKDTWSVFAVYTA
eukprot:6174028-Pleurochrysis_carterae.AAC.1